VRVRVLLLGEDPRDPLQQAAVDYLARAGRRMDAGLVPLKPGKRSKSADDTRIKDDEADLLLKSSEGCTRVAMDAGGALLTSEEFAAALENLLARGKPVAFLFGGATGLHSRVKEQSQATWSLSRMTYAHRLACLALCEQIYRAAEIARGGPYHK
jgi:23S rRNA (pseudouridine1915-N3)-methyltransferase